jgi:hypothetical protein
MPTPLFNELLRFLKISQREKRNETGPIKGKKRLSIGEGKKRRG